jgi:HAD superfamily 5'-nucleotidase-like hydrolase
VYDDQAVNELAFAETCRNMVEFRGYPSSITSLEYDDAVIARGIVADTDTGALIKLDSTGRVLRAVFGRMAMGPEETRAIYGHRRIDVERSGYDEIQSPFDLPAGALFAAMAQRIRSDSERDYRAALTDIREMLDRAHTRGELKGHIVRDTGLFVEKRPGVADMLARLRAGGTKTFILTNSGYEYSVELLDFLFPASVEHPGGWRSLFDAVVTHAGKPAFFDGALVDGPDANARVDWHEPGHDSSIAVWSGGGVSDLEAHLGARGEQILFVGDNIAADAQPARSRGWRSALVVPELSDDPSVQLAAEPKEVVPRTDGLWGSVFWENGVPTRFNHAIRRTTDLCAARVEAILRGALDGGFEAG